MINIHKLTVTLIYMTKTVLTRILLITTIVIIILFCFSTKSLLLGMKCVSKHQDSQIFVLKLNK